MTSEKFFQCVVVFLLTFIICTLCQINSKLEKITSYYDTCIEEEAATTNYGSTAPELEKHFIYNVEK